MWAEFGVFDLCVKVVVLFPKLLELFDVEWYIMKNLVLPENSEDNQTLQEER